jgi:TrmH family RNA methyltransferase
MSALTRNQIALIKSLYTRHGRKKNNLCIVDGLRCCSDFLASGNELLELLICDTALAGTFEQYHPFVVTKEEIATLSSTIANQGVIAVARRPAEVPTGVLPPDPFILVLDRIADPGNLGTILRTAKAVGLKEVWLTAGTVDPFSDKTIRAAMAAQFSLGLRRFESLHELKHSLLKFGFSKIFRTDPHTGQNCFCTQELFDHSAIIIGNEANGAAILDDSVSVKIPMPGNSESLNAAQATTVLLFEYVRRTFVETPQSTGKNSNTASKTASFIPMSEQS